VRQEVEYIKTLVNTMGAELGNDWGIFSGANCESQTRKVVLLCSHLLIGSVASTLVPLPVEWT